MPRYKLHVDEVVNRMNFLEIETPLNERELDALLSKIEHKGVTSALDLKNKLETQGVKIRAFSVNNQSFYRCAETLEIEELEEKKEKQGFIIQCKGCDLDIKDIEQAIENAREKMNLSIEQTDINSDITIQLSQELDTLLVTEMRIRV